MKQLRILATIYLTALLLCSCNNDEDELIVSPFENFLGTWQLESEVINGNPSENLVTHIMLIEENQDLTDSLATGYYEIDGQRTDLTLELTANEKEIYLQRGHLTFICTYDFLESDRFELDDTNEFASVITIWKR